MTASKLTQTLLIIASTCMLSPAMAETKPSWDNTAKITAQPIDDSALEAVSARGSLDETAVKALKAGSKLSDQNAGATNLSSQFGLNAAESADKQAVNSQLRMAMTATQTVGATMQLTAVTATVAAPISPAPLIGLPAALGFPGLAGGLR